MGAINITNARKDLYRIVDSVNESHEPVHIIGKNSAAVLIGEEDWRSIQKTLYLLSIKGMRDSIVEGIEEPCAQNAECRILNSIFDIKLHTVFEKRLERRLDPF